ncbi:hypothetical protein AAHH80_32235, partial [Burkholderia pseudomallei]
GGAGDWGFGRSCKRAVLYDGDRCIFFVIVVVFFIVLDIFLFLGLVNVFFLLLFDYYLCG